MAKRLGEILLEKNLITSAQLEEATEIQCLYGGKLGTSLIELGAIDEDTLGHVLSKALHVPYFKPILLMEIAPEVLALVPRQLALKHMVVPYKLQGKRLLLAMTDPNDLSAIDDLSFHLGYSIVPLVVPELRLALALNKYHKRKLSPRFINLGKQLMQNARRTRTDAAARHTAADAAIAGLQEFKAEVLEKDAIRNVEDLEKILDVKDLLATEEISDRDKEIWPLLGADNGGTANLAEADYRELTTLGASVERAQKLQPEPVAATADSAEPRELSSFFVQLTKAEDRDDIASCLIDYLAREFGTGGILMIKGEQAMGWQATVDGKPVADFDRFHVALDQPSVLLTVAQSKTYYLGPIPETVQNIMLIDNFGPDLPEAVLLVPLLLRGRLVSILYVQDQAGRISDKLADLQRLVAKSAMAFEMLVLKNKILMS